MGQFLLKDHLPSPFPKEIGGIQLPPSTRPHGFCYHWVERWVSILDISFDFITPYLPPTWLFSSLRDHSSEEKQDQLPSIAGVSNESGPVGQINGADLTHGPDWAHRLDLHVCVLDCPAHHVQHMGPIQHILHVGQLQDPWATLTGLHRPMGHIFNTPAVCRSWTVSSQLLTPGSSLWSQIQDR